MFFFKHTVRFVENKHKKINFNKHKLCIKHSAKTLLFQNYGASKKDEIHCEKTNLGKSKTYRKPSCKLVGPYCIL